MVRSAADRGAGSRHATHTLPDGQLGGRHKVIDLSSIDFEVIAKRFATTTRKNVELEQLRAAVRQQLDALVRVNPTRADYLTKFEVLVESDRRRRRGRK